ncbi:GNAT family N-acetyltransferase [Clostridium uliginosum]|uniref:Protein N-acetyltransferase, RimJ/RimL family n=1 Tax=Clostridium uliginosum TaxID=119641 RepID=A0A1I1H1F1_9CLOT|nr:GNAT family N-acetyltransferase [Clostridium uliginosum]SFC17877.1 Protein N-acetyltransferase, RimJ/RimL family [Clostridium uliginosum]
MNICIETERLILRQFSVNDTVKLNAICNEPNILKWMPDWESSVDIREKWIEWIEKQYLIVTRTTARIMLAVTIKTNGRLIGMIGIGNKEEVDNEIEIAYFVSEKFSNKGYITEATKAMTKWAFDNLNLDYLIAIVELDNLSSQRVIEKSDFIKVETRMILNSGETEEKPFYYYRLYNKHTKSMNFRVENFTENYAKQICNWKYDNNYSIYNFPKWHIIVKENWAIAIETKRQNEFVAVINELDDLCGYIRFINNSDFVLIGLGLKPSLCGQGLGNNIMALLKSECKRKYGNKKIVLEVRSFNQRAIKCYKKAGFKTIDIYNKDTLIGSDEFIKMEFSY